MFGVLVIAGLLVAVLAYVISHPLSSGVLTSDLLIPCLVLSIVFMAWVCWVLWSRWTIAKTASALAASDNPRDMIDALRTYSQSSLICTVAAKRLFDLCQDKTGGEQCRGVASRAGGAELLLTAIQSHSKNDLAVVWACRALCVLLAEQLVRAQLCDAGAGVLMSNVLSTVTSPPAAAGVCMLLGGFSDGDSITGHAAAMDDMVASVAGASSEWPTDEDVQTWALFFFLNVSGYVAASEKPESSGTDALDRKKLEQTLLHDCKLLTLLSSALSSCSGSAAIARMACLILVALQVEDYALVQSSGILPLLQEAQRKFPNQHQVQQFVPALLLKYSLAK